LDRRERVLELLPEPVELALDGGERGLGRSDRLAELRTLCPGGGRDGRQGAQIRGRRAGGLGPTLGELNAGLDPGDACPGLVLEAAEIAAQLGELGLHASPSNSDARLARASATAFFARMLCASASSARPRRVALVSLTARLTSDWSATTDWSTAAPASSTWLS